jgi:LPS-assembly lipoprotein
VLAAVVLAAPLLAGCAGAGFRPMYSAGLDQRLAAVEYANIPGRVGQRIRNELVFHSTGGGNPAPATHRLEVAISESVSTTLVDRTGESQSQVYNLDARFRLVRIADRKVVLEGNSASRAALERFPSIYANVRAREDAENRAARTVAEELKTRLAAHLATAG